MGRVHGRAFGTHSTGYRSYSLATFMGGHTWGSDMAGRVTAASRAKTAGLSPREGLEGIDKNSEAFSIHPITQATADLQSTVHWESCVLLLLRAIRENRERLSVSDKLMCSDRLG